MAFNNSTLSCHFSLQNKYTEQEAAKAQDCHVGLDITKEPPHRVLQVSTFFLWHEVVPACNIYIYIHIYNSNVYVAFLFTKTHLLSRDARCLYTLFVMCYLFLGHSQS